MSTVYFSKDDRRRDIIATQAGLNGIDFLEVLDSPALPLDQRQRTLFVHFINDPGALALGPGNVVVEGGERITGIQIITAQVVVDPRSGDPLRPVLVVTVDQRGDFSTYTLHLVENPAAPGALTAFDPVLRDVDFSFKVNCPSDFDCQVDRVCPPELRREPPIDYLARDFNSLRQVLRDRMAVIAPDWAERNVADIGVTLVELFAYLGDQLSYRQDAVATEAYLGTARRRISVRRHARLADYAMHDGCNARVWIQVRIDPTVTADVLLPKGRQILSAVPGQPPLIHPNSSGYLAAIGAGAQVFETLHDATLHAEHNELRFYTWGARESCLPRGAVKASLRGKLIHLQPGDFLLFREVRNPRSGDAADAAFENRQVVRLTEVVLRVDPIGGQFEPVISSDPIDVTDIRWATEDALRFPLCISSEKDDEFGGGYVDDLSLAYGNLVLADHGKTLPPEPIGEVPSPTVARIPVAGPSDEEDPSDEVRPHLVYAPIRFRPTLKEGPLTQASPFPASVFELTSATAAFATDPSEASPAVTLTSLRHIADLPLPWNPQRDLLNSDGDAREFVVEIDNDSTAVLRFGDGTHGAGLSPGLQFTATYRVGNGTQGNVGAGSLVHLVTTDGRIESVTNPLPAEGGVAAETIEEVRQRAPYAFRQKQQRAVTPADYAAQAAQYAGVQRAAATLRWTGSWHTLFLSVDRLGGGTIDPAFSANLTAALEPVRMAGVDLDVEPPEPVALELSLTVYVRAGYFRSDIEAALLEIFTSAVTRTGQLGAFHPDRFTFGQTVYLSPWVALAQAVAGVASVDVTTFQRRDDPGTSAIDAGLIKLGRLEVPVLDNNRNFPERGTFTLNLKGGK